MTWGARGAELGRVDSSGRDAVDAGPLAQGVVQAALALLGRDEQLADHLTGMPRSLAYRY